MFPDEYHLATIEQLLELITQKVEPKVDSKVIIQNLMGRLGDFALNTPLPENLDLFEIFYKSLENIHSSSESEMNSLLDLYVSFTKFSLSTNPTNLENINKIFVQCSQLDFSNLTEDYHYESLVKLLSEPLESLKLQIIQFKEYPKLLNYLPSEKKKKVAQSIFNAALDQGL